MLKSYRTIKGDGIHEVEIDKSRFICEMRRTEKEEDAQAFINEIKEKHADATHNCSAYQIGENNEIQRAHDDGEPTGTAGIFVDAEGRNCIVIGPGANADLSASHVESQREAIRAARVLLVQLESPVEAIEAALRIAREAGATMVLNPAPANAPTTEAMLALADVITPNESEFSALIERHTAMAIPAHAIATAGDEALHLLCRTLHPRGCVVVTLGAMGSFVSHAEANARGDKIAHYRVGAAPAEAIDTTGAGDAFNGALCASLAARPEAAFAEHLGFASRYAARSTENKGAALAMPRL